MHHAISHRVGYRVPTNAHCSYSTHPLFRKCASSVNKTYSEKPTSWAYSRNSGQNARVHYDLRRAVVVPFGDEMSLVFGFTEFRLFYGSGDGTYAGTRISLYAIQRSLLNEGIFNRGPPSLSLLPFKDLYSPKL